MAALLANREFVKILVGFGVGLGLFNALLTDLGQLVQPLYCHAGNATDGGGADGLVCDYAASSADAGMFGLAMIGTGLVGAGAVGFALDATHLYRPFLKGGFVLSLCGMLFCMLELKPHNTAVLAPCKHSAAVQALRARRWRDAPAHVLWCARPHDMDGKMHWRACSGMHRPGLLNAWRTLPINHRVDALVEAAVGA